MSKDYQISEYVTLNYNENLGYQFHLKHKAFVELPLTRTEAEALLNTLRGILRLWDQKRLHRKIIDFPC